MKPDHLAARIIVLGFVLGVMAPVGLEIGEARAADSVADRVHQSIMRDHPRYPQYQTPKALAGCFDWQNSKPDEPDVRFLAVATPLTRGRGSTGVGRLASNALDRCRRGRQRHDAPCECQVIDRNGRNAIEPPADFSRRFQ